MTPTPHLSLGLALTCTAGFADAVGFIVLGGRYVSFMSGNTTQMGDAITQWQPALVALPALLVLLFLAGSFAGSVLAIAGERRWGPASVTALTLAGFVATLAMATGPLSPATALPLLAFSAGAQNAILPAAGAVRLGTTFVTGTLFAAGQDMARALFMRAPSWRWAQHLLVWISLILGAAFGAISYHHAGIWSLIGPILVYAGFVIAFCFRRPAAVLS